MIQRIVLIQLDPQFRSERAAVADHSREVLSAIPDVQGLRVVTPADERTERDWDLCIAVELADLEAVERYRGHERHRKYVDIYLRPMLAKIRAYNFGEAAV